MTDVPTPTSPGPVQGGPFTARLGGRDLWLNFKDGTGFVLSPDMPDEAMIALAAWLNRKVAKLAAPAHRAAALGAAARGARMAGGLDWALTLFGRAWSEWDAACHVGPTSKAIEARQKLDDARTTLKACIAALADPGAGRATERAGVLVAAAQKSQQAPPDCGEGAALPGVEEIAEESEADLKHTPRSCMVWYSAAARDAIAQGEMRRANVCIDKMLSAFARLAARGAAPEGDDPAPTDPADRVRRWVGERTGTWLDRNGAAELVRVATAGQAAPAAGDGLREAVALARSDLAQARRYVDHSRAAERWILKADDRLRTALASAAGGGAGDTVTMHHVVALRRARTLYGLRNPESVEVSGFDFERDARDLVLRIAERGWLPPPTRPDDATSGAAP